MMFTGIIQGIGEIANIERSEKLWRLVIQLPGTLSQHIEHGASIAIDGVCLTVVNYQQSLVSFDVIDETLQRTTLKKLSVGDHVNIERSARVGDEIGGHQVSGHIHDTVEIIAIKQPANNYVISFKINPDLLEYTMPKGYIALNGASLTIVDVDNTHAYFSVHLIPETLARTTFSKKAIGDHVNIEIDQTTISTVNTVKNYLAHNKLGTR